MKNFKLLLVILIVVIIAIGISIFVITKMNNETETSETTEIVTESILSEEQIDELSELQTNYTCLFEVNEVSNNLVTGSFCVVDTVSEEVLNYPNDVWIDTEFGNHVGLVSYEEAEYFLEFTTPDDKGKLLELVKEYTDVTDHFIYDQERGIIYCLSNPVNGKCSIIGGPTWDCDLIYKYKDMTLKMSPLTEYVSTYNNFDALDTFISYFNSLKSNSEENTCLGYVTVSGDTITRFEECFIP